MMSTKQTTIARTSFGMLAGAACAAVADHVTAAPTFGTAVRVRIPGTPAWSPPVC